MKNTTNEKHYERQESLQTTVCVLKGNVEINIRNLSVAHFATAQPVDLLRQVLHVGEVQQQRALELKAEDVAEHVPLRDCGARSEAGAGVPRSSQRHFGF